MKRLIAALLAVTLLLSGCAMRPNVLDGQMRGVWISYLEYGRILTGKTEQEFTESISQMFARLSEEGYNTAVVQVRSHGDAYYPSELYPWSKYVTGTVGVDPGFDPLAIMVQQAHLAGLSLQAWINPYRLMRDEELALVSQDYAVARWFGESEYMVKEGEYWYLNPGSPAVQELIFTGVQELVTNYAVDGVQIDDYFYVPTAAAFGHTETQARSYTSQMVRGIYDTIKNVDESLLFGVSPAGNYTDVPVSDLTQLTDLVTWCTTPGYMDYVAPQIYWGFEDENAPFEQVLRRWEELCAGGPVALVVGLAAYKFPTGGEIERQIERVESSPVARGYLIFRYDDWFPPSE
ncbi:glycoside hydrolase family 10 protein [Feifania hominis]|uniref:Family 10 glycosylhydrolase n=1 Tax=Feifania hominis TaxID=2763660 RepID=A0A926DFC1_9FIRM|nr:family 10 glycosylhydrolase [Feifania hominis]MBC8536249.1 family 10 glycosylhydrolase [Feifania hominis]